MDQDEMIYSMSIAQIMHLWVNSMIFWRIPADKAFNS